MLHQKSALQVLILVVRSCWLWLPSQPPPAAKVPSVTGNLMMVPGHRRSIPRVTAIPPLWSTALPGSLENSATQCPLE